MDEPWRDVEAAGDWLLQLADIFQPDIVHLNGYAHGALPWDVPVLMAGHSCVLSWWNAVRKEDAPASWNRYQSEIRQGIKEADLVVAPTQAMLDDLEKYYGPLPQSQVIYNGREAEYFSPKNKEPFIFAAGRLWDEAKNISALAQVAPNITWPVYVAGDARHPNNEEATFSNVHTLGRIESETLADWMGRASIYALPARYEPFGLSILEAALSGCALVLGDIPSLREVWGDAAIFVAPDNNAALEHALRDLINNENKRLNMAEAAMQRARYFSTQKMAEAYLAAYHELSPVEAFAH
jgi:glycosyltransferase involved in cell wall biosynthesis